MDPVHRETRSPPPSATSSVGSRRSRFHIPLSNHGMPKTPPPMSPDGSFRSHRFSGLRSPRALRPSGPSSPPLSPPMSARSFGTFIDSAPSTPALSPRQPSHWDGSTLLLLSPAQASTSPKSPMDPSPIEPEWEMIVPGRRKSESSLKAQGSRSESPSSSARQSEVESPSKLRSRLKSDASKQQSPPKGEVLLRARSASPLQSPSKSDSEPERQPIPYTIPKPWYPVKREDMDAQKENQPPNQDSHSHSDTFGKLATRMKSILRRKDSSQKKVVKQTRRRHDVDRMEDVHWSEM